MKFHLNANIIYINKNKPYVHTHDPKRTKNLHIHHSFPWIRTSLESESPHITSRMKSKESNLESSEMRGQIQNNMDDAESEMFL